MRNASKRLEKRLAPRSWFCERNVRVGEERGRTMEYDGVSACCWAPYGDSGAAFRHVSDRIWKRHAGPPLSPSYKLGSPRPDTKRLARTVSLRCRGRSMSSPYLPNFLTKFYLTLLTLYFVGKQSRHLTGCAKEFSCLGSFDGNTRPRCMLVAAEPSRLHCRGHLSRALAVQSGVG
jgi:hypothetical protein